MEKKKHFSMLRSFALADLFTLGNVVCGMAAILVCLHHLASPSTSSLGAAFWLLPLSLFFDTIDGRVARWRQKFSPLGADLDSLADAISFGVAPAVLGFCLGLRGWLNEAVLVYFVACGISRLARYNVTASQLSDESGKVKYFEGTPIPTSLGIVFLLWFQYHAGLSGEQLWGGVVSLGPVSFHVFVLVYLLLGSTMVSGTLRIPKP